MHTLQASSVILISILLIAGCIPQMEEPETKGDSISKIEILKQEVKKKQTEESGPKEVIQGENHPLSLKSFIEGEFIGSDFTIGNLLTDWGSHKSYYASYKSNGLKISTTWHIPNREGSFPLLILNHGYFPPNTYTNGYGFGREQKHFARHGYAVLHIDYRGYAYSDTDPEALTGPRLGYMGYSADAVNAIKALEAAQIPNIDLSRVGMFGHSLGGGVTLNAILSAPELIHAAVLWGPVSANYQDNYHKWTKDRMTRESKNIFESAFGPLNNPSSFKALSPLSYIDQLSVPLLIQHGTADESCPIEWSRTLAKALSKTQANYKYIEYEEFPHVFWNENWDIAIEEATKFFDQNL